MAKRKMKTWIILGSIALLITVGLLVLSSQTPEGEEEVLAGFEEAGLTVELKKFESERGLIRYAYFPNPEGQKLLLIHGSPGDWSAWSNVFLNPEVRRTYEIVAIDRAGYKGTEIPATGSLADQAWVGIELAHHLWPKSHYVVVGHSYGGAVAEEVLLNDQDWVSGAVLASATLSPDEQEPKWYNKMGKWKLSQWVMPEALKSSNIEMMPLSDELEANEEQVRNETRPVVVIHGKEDVLVPFSSVDYFKSLMPGAEYILNDTMNHFVPWSHPDLLNNAILSLAE